jgi:hypothetical protein
MDYWDMGQSISKKNNWSLIFQEVFACPCNMEPVAPTLTKNISVSSIWIFELNIQKEPYFLNYLENLNTQNNERIDLNTSEEKSGLRSHLWTRKY